ncbi:peptidoglycan-binding protein [Antarctobacter sp.]|uniref:peptidoglycan-binding protein n=1 Tax=Antarctobacter sp. TaxID=1872577 RepID=UPI003A907D45
MTAALFRRSILPALMCGAVFAPVPAKAGDIVTTTGKHFDCAATLTGEIATGDLDKIRALDSRSFASGTRPLCLDSAGGSFAEAIRIADYLYDRGIPTAVDDGAACLSSCAFAFLGGSSSGKDRQPEPNKSLHLNAELGFGSLARVLDAGQYADGQTLSAMDAALKSASEITARMDKFQMTADFAAQVMALQDSDILYVDRVDEARALGLRLEGFEAPSSLGDEMVTRACIRENADFDPDRSRPDQSVYDHRVLRESGASAHRKATYLVEAIVDGVPSWIGCQVELTSAPATADDPAASIKLRTSKDWTTGGNPRLREVHVRLVPEEWREFPFRDFWKLIPEDQTLQDARKMASADASGSIIVDAVGDLPRTTAGTEALMDLRYDDRQAIQNRLTLLGFDTRGADGIFGPGTRQALRDWQDSNGFDATGFLDSAQRDVLVRQSEAQYAEFLEEERREEAERQRVQNAPAPVFNRPAALDPAPQPEPQGQRVRVCQRTIFGELVNCRIEFR